LSHSGKGPIRGNTKKTRDRFCPGYNYKGLEKSLGKGEERTVLGTGPEEKSMEWVVGNNENTPSQCKVATVREGSRG